MVLFSSVLIDGIETKSKLLNWFVEKTHKDKISFIQIKFTKDVNDLIEINNGKTIEVNIGTSDPVSTPHFRGFVERIDKQGATIDVIGRDKLSETKRKEVTEIFNRDISIEGGNISRIAKNIIEQNTSLLVTASTTLVTIAEFRCNHHQVYERVDKLREALDWQIYYDVTTDKVILEPKGTTVYSTPLIVGTNINRVGDWRFDTHNIVNNLTIIAGFQMFKDNNTFTGDGTTTDFQLDFIPFKDVKVTVDSVVQKGGLDEVSTDVEFTVDTNKDERKIKFKTAPSDSTAIVVDYNYQVPIVVTGREEESIKLYGEYERTLFFPDISLVEDARRKHKTLITELSTPFVEGTLNLTNIIDIAPGNTVTVTDIQNGINNETKIVHSVRTDFPSGITQIIVGDRDIEEYDQMALIKKRIDELERELAGTPEVIIKVKQFLEEIKVSVENFTIQSIITTGDTAIVGHSAYGLVGTAKVGTGGGTGPLVTTVRRAYIFNKKKDYEEWTKDANIIVQNNRLIMR